MIHVAAKVDNPESSLPGDYFVIPSGRQIPRQIQFAEWRINSRCIPSANIFVPAAVFFGDERGLYGRIPLPMILSGDPTRNRIHDMRASLYPARYR